MSQDRDELAFRRAEDAEEVEIRRDAGEPIIVGGYIPGRGDRARPFPGDEQFPYYKDPPATLQPRRYTGRPVRESGGAVVPAPNLPLVAALADFAVGDTIDVRGIRLITFFLEYLPNAGTLIIVPQARVELPEQGTAPDDINAEFFPIGVVDPTLITVSAILDCGAFREFFATELRQVATTLAVTDSCRSTLVFDVTPYSDFRLLTGDVVTALSGLNAFHVMQR